MSPPTRRIKSKTRVLYPVLPTKSLTEIEIEISKLRAPPGYTQDTAKSDRVEGKYTDFDIICDDGTVFKVHKLVVCPQVVAIDLALKKCFKVWTTFVDPSITDRRKEGQTNQYFLRGQKSSVVSRFLNFVYGANPDICNVGPKIRTRASPVLLMAEVFALADELQAERVFSCCLAWLKLAVPFYCDKGDESVIGDIIDGMQYIHQNAHRKDSIITCFISACVTVVTKTDTELKRKLILGWFRLAPEYTSDFLESLLTVSGNVLSKLFDESFFDRIWAVDGVDEIVVDGCSGGKTLQLSSLWEHDGFRNAVVEAGLLKKVSSGLVEEALQTAESVRAIADADRCIIDYETDSLRFCKYCCSLVRYKSAKWSGRRACCSSNHSYYESHIPVPVLQIVELDEEGSQLRSVRVHQDK